VGEGAEIVHGNFEDLVGKCPAQNSILEESGEEAGKDGKDVKAHLCP
jgi:hypothetical protein